MYNMDYLRWLRELNGLQLKKTDANRKSTSKLRKHLHQFDNKCAVNTQNTEKLCKLTIQPNTEMHCKYLQHNQIQKCTANTYNTTKYRNLLQILTTQPNTEMCCKFLQHNQTQKHTANSQNTTLFLYLVVLPVFAPRFCIWLLYIFAAYFCIWAHCEYLQCMCCQTDEDVFLKV